MFNSKKAEMGVGTLIIFIAMILVAAIAAGVLIQTQTSLQSKALLTGDKSKDQVATSVQTVSLAATDGSSNNDVETFFQTLKLAPGSESIRLSDAIVIFATNNQSESYSYDSTANCDSVPASSTGKYAVRYLIGGNNAGYLERGDVAMVCYSSPRAVTESENVRITFMPKIGNPMVLDIGMPEIITNTRTQIFPGN